MKTFKDTNQIWKLGLIPMVFLSLSLSSGLESEEKLIRKAKKIHKSVFTIDSHTDTPLRFMNAEFDMNTRNSAEKSHSKIDFPRMEEGGLDAVFFAVFTGQGERTPEAHHNVKEKALSIFSAVHETILKSGEKAQLARSTKEGYLLDKQGKKAIFIGIENGYPIGNDTANIREFYNLGARYITLCHTRNNEICDSSTDSTEHNGVSDFGENVIEKMNDLGIMIDVSHISDKAFYDVIQLSKAPVIASHSCARALCDHPRNMTDDMLKKLAENDGVIQICFVSEYLIPLEPDSNRIEARNDIRKKYNNFKNLSDEKYKKAVAEWYAIDEKYPPALASVSDLVDHIDHVVQTIGIDHVGIGSDFDGGGALSDCFDVSQLENITIELVRRGYSKKDIEKIWGGNFMRVFAKAEELARN